MKIFLSILILLPSLCFSLTFKKDGSIITSSGEIQRESIATRYQNALEQYKNGEEIAAQLHGTYTAIIASLWKYSKERNAQQLKKILEALMELKDAWEIVGRQ